jgi:hypothetical protein
MRIAVWAGSSLPNVGDRLLAAVTETELSRRLPGAEFAHFCPWSPAPAPSPGPAPAPHPDDAARPDTTAGPASMAAASGGADHQGSPATVRASGGTGRSGSAVDPVPLWVDGQGRWPGAGMFDAVVMAGGVWSGPPFRHPIMQVFCLGSAPRAFDPGTFAAWHGVGLQDGTPEPDRPEWRAYLSEVRARLGHATVRGAYAAARMDGLTVVPDPAFALPPLRRERPRGKRIGVAVSIPGPSRRLIARLATRTAMPYDPGLCLPPEQVMAEADAPHEQAARLGFVADLGLTLMELGGLAEVEFLAVDNIYGDDETAGQLARSVAGATVTALGSTGADHGVGPLCEAFARCDVVLVSRYHSAILALRTGTPFVAVDPFWSRRNGTSKLCELMNQLGLAHRYWNGDGDLPQIVNQTLDSSNEPLEEPLYRDMWVRAGAAFDRLADDLRAHARQGTGAR